MLIMPLYFQLVRGEDAVTPGLLLIPQGVGAAIAMGISGRMTDRIGGGRVALLGLGVTLLTTIPFVALTASTSYLDIGGAMIARGFGLGLTMMPAMTAAATACLGARRRIFGQSFGSAKNYRP